MAKSVHAFLKPAMSPPRVVYFVGHGSQVEMALDRPNAAKERSWLIAVEFSGPE
jgi:hypothetical protein